MYLTDRDQLHALITTRRVPLDELARQAHVPCALLQALLAGDIASCSYGPARRLETVPELAPAELFVPDLARKAHIVRRLAAG